MSSVAPRQRHGIDHLRPYLCGGLAAVAAEMVTFPLDTAKTRQQLQKRGFTAKPKNSSTSMNKYFYDR